MNRSKKEVPLSNHPVPDPSAAEDVPGEEGLIRKSLVLSQEIYREVARLQEGSGEGFSAVIRSLLRTGLAAQEEGAMFTDMVVLRNPAAGWIKEAAIKLDMPAEALLLRIVTEGLARLLQESEAYTKAKQFLQEHLSPS